MFVQPQAGELGSHDYLKRHGESDFFSTSKVNLPWSSVLVPVPPKPSVRPVTGSFVSSQSTRPSIRYALVIGFDVAALSVRGGYLLFRNPVSRDALRAS